MLIKTLAISLGRVLTTFSTTMHKTQLTPTQGREAPTPIIKNNWIIHPSPK